MANSAHAENKYCMTFLSTTVYADQKINVTFDTQGIGSAENSTVTVVAGQEIPEFATLSADGYIFRGWSTAKKGVGEYDVDADAFNRSTVIYEDTTLYAMWESAYHKIAFDPNGGTGSKEMSVYKGDSFNLPENPFTAPEGKTFDKWEAGVPGDAVAHACPCDCNCSADDPHS